ncbi:putative oXIDOREDUCTASE [Mycobacterium xenopi 3993]|nr:putative oXIDOREDUCTASE [Mycobacterium xenopi 3993]
MATEDDQIRRRGLTAYVQSRVQAEDLVLRYASEHALPAVAMCVSTTYGSGDWAAPHMAPSSPARCSASCLSDGRHRAGSGRRRRRCPSVDIGR